MHPWCLYRQISLFDEFYIFVKHLPSSIKLWAQCWTIHPSLYIWHHLCLSHLICPLIPCGVEWSINFGRGSVCLLLCILMPRDSFIPSIHLLQGRPLPLSPLGLYIIACCGVLFGGSRVTWLNHLTCCFWIKSNTGFTPTLLLISSFLILSFLDTLSILLLTLAVIVQVWHW